MIKCFIIINLIENIYVIIQHQCRIIIKDLKLYINNNIYHPLQLLKLYL